MHNLNGNGLSLSIKVFFLTFLEWLLVLMAADSPQFILIDEGHQKKEHQREN